MIKLVMGIKFIKYNPIKSKMKRISVLILCFLIMSYANAQNKFQIVANHDKDSVVWYIKNLNKDSIKLGAATLDFFYQTQNLMIWPYEYFGGNRYYQRTGKFCGEKYCWKYKTEIGMGLDAWVKPGDSFPIISGDNYAAKDFDTLMMANFELYWSDTSGISHKTIVTPSGSTCAYESLFLSAGDLPDKGIKKGSNAYFQMHEGSKKYLFGSNIAIAILFDNYTLKPYWVSSVFPQNPAGQMWKDFGYPIDSQVFYQFRMANSLNKKTGTLDSIIDGMNTGDYIALVSYNTYNIDSNDYRSVFAKIGVNVASLKGGQCFTILGRKDLPIGKAQVKIAGDPLAGSSLKIPIIKQQPTNECLNYASCFEKYVFKLNPYVHKPHLKVNKSRVSQMKIWPNPSESGVWNIQIPQDAFNLEVLDITGKKIHVQPIPSGVKGVTLNASDFELENQHGIYVIRVLNAQGQLLSAGKVIK